MPHRRHPIWQQVQESAGRNPHLQPWPAGLQAKSCVCIGRANNFEHASERFAQELQLAAVREHHRGGTPGCLVLALEIQLSHMPLYRNQFLQCGQKTPARWVQRPLLKRDSQRLVAGPLPATRQPWAAATPPGCCRERPQTCGCHRAAVPEEWHKLPLLHCHCLLSSTAMRHF